VRGVRERRLGWGRNFPPVPSSFSWQRNWREYEWKTDWEASGFTILEEEEFVLEQGLPAVQFTIQTPDGTAVFLLATLVDRYLMLSGEGDLELVKEIVQRIRPISVK
jgi:hypothetical protein